MEKIKLQKSLLWGKSFASVSTLLTISGVLCSAVLIANAFIYGSPFRFSPVNPAFDYDPLGSSYFDDSDFVNPSEQEDPDCQHTVEGSSLVADDEGFVCSWSDLVHTNTCCPQLDGSRFDCKTCNASRCCLAFEYCVSCCMGWSHVQKNAFAECRYSVLTSVLTLF